MRLCVYQLNITGAGCGVTKLCVELPDHCDPAENQTCLFMSGIANPPMASGDTNLTIELSGQSSGYIALGLVANASEVKCTKLQCLCYAESSSDQYCPSKKNFLQKVIKT